MAEDRADLATQAVPDLAAGRSPQTIEPHPAREAPRKSRSEPERKELQEGDAARSLSTARGDLPEALKRRYFSEDGRTVTAFFSGPGAKTPAFRDHGARLSTHDVDPNTIRDMVAIAAHRGWRTLQVRGDDDFRREVWMEARAAGLQVRGYRPRQRDEQELEVRLGGANQRTISPAEGRDKPPEATRRPVQSPPDAARADFDAGVRGVLLEAGEAPYRRRPGQPLTPFVRLDRGADGALDVWGVGLPDALARSGARPGDQVLVRRDGVDRVQKTIEVKDSRTGETTRQRRETPRNRWTILAERFREASPAEAARDPELKAALSQLAVARTVIEASLRDPERQARVYSDAKAQVSAKLAEGRRFREARVQETTAERPAPALRRTDRNAAEVEPGPERTRRR
ncbi:DNA primase [Phenylobacterium sp. LjRoot219]|uniref:LPD7 domain-containing protein n=1 Tax=Phenylobacterium sp. LjRoot219 TaxID=3342283 RepID=UPI003ECE4089